MSHKHHDSAERSRRKKAGDHKTRLVNALFVAMLAIVLLLVVGGVVALLV